MSPNHLYTPQNEALLTFTRLHTPLQPGLAPALADAAPVNRSAPVTDRDLLTMLGQASFVWDIASDALHWSDNVGAVLRDIPPA